MVLLAYISRMADDPKSTTAIPTLEDWQHWTLVMGRAQQMLMEFWADQMKQGQAMPAWSHSSLPPAFGFGEQAPASDPMALMTAGAQAWAKGLETWGRMMGLDTEAKENARDRRFAAPEWQESPVFDTIRKTYLALSDKLLGSAENAVNTVHRFGRRYHKLEFNTTSIGYV